MDSTHLRLRVSPGARRAAIVGPYGDGWKVCVTQPPEDGRANEAVVRLIAETLGLPRGGVTLVSGRRSRDKVVACTGIEPAHVEARLASAARTERVA
ncbi:MAG TPA: DUF167 domain-containing protein [Gaiellaceae bacterium]|nr:DUF167 domain-containing protein [Gaiellaceae bacterium]